MSDRVSIIESESVLDGDFASIAMLDDAHPQRQRCRLRLFHAPGRARVAAIINPRLVDAAGAPIGLLGFFAALDDEDAARAVLTAGATWLREQGATIVRGPIDYSTWNDYRLTLHATEPGWFAGEPANPDYYVRLWRAAGFEQCSAYGTYWMDDPPAVTARMEARAQRAYAAGIEVRPVAAPDLPALYQLAQVGFRDAYMFSPLEPDEFAAIYGADRAATAGATSYVAVDGGKPLGFLYTFEAELPRGRVGVCKSIAILPEARDRGVYHALFGRALRSLLDRGMRDVLLALIHLDGTPALMGWSRPDLLFKQYGLFELHT